MGGLCWSQRQEAPQEQPLPASRQLPTQQERGWQQDAIEGWGKSPCNTSLQAPDRNFAPHNGAWLLPSQAVAALSGEPQQQAGAPDSLLPAARGADFMQPHAVVCQPGSSMAAAAAKRGIEQRFGVRIA